MFAATVPMLAKPTTAAHLLCDLITLREAMDGQNKARCCCRCYCCCRPLLILLPGRQGPRSSCCCCGAAAALKRGLAEEQTCIRGSLGWVFRHKGIAVHA
jgi:hypothetical protein